MAITQNPVTSKTTLAENAQVLTNTTTVKRVAGSVVTNVQIIPYMRALAIDLLGYKLRPNRQIWFYNTLMEMDFLFVHNQIDKKYIQTYY